MFSLLFNAHAGKLRYMTKPYRDFDLSTRHLTGANHYIPPKARSSSEIERRHELPRGTVLVEQEMRGIAVARLILERVGDQPDVDFAVGILAPAAYNTSWYGVGQTSKVMRRQLKLPVLGQDAEDRPTSAQLLSQSRRTFDTLELYSGVHLGQKINKSACLSKTTEGLGRMVGNAALELSAVPIGDSLLGTTPFDAQNRARIAGLQTVQAAHQLEEETGMPPSLAQLADPDSDLSVHIRRQAPYEVYVAFDEAISTLAIPR